MKTDQLIQLGLALLPLVQTGLQEFVSWLTALRAAARQSGEWTPEQDAAFEAAIEDKRNAPEQQPDPPEDPATPA